MVLRRFLSASVPTLMLVGSLWGQTPNQPPVISGPDQAVLSEGGVVNVTVSASDPDGDPLSYSWVIENSTDFGGNAVLNQGGGASDNFAEIGLNPGSAFPSPKRLGLHIQRLGMPTVPSASCGRISRHNIL